MMNKILIMFNVWLCLLAWYSKTSTLDMAGNGGKTPTQLLNIQWIYGYITIINQIIGYDILVYHLTNGKWPYTKNGVSGLKIKTIAINITFLNFLTYK